MNVYSISVLAVAPRGVHYKQKYVASFGNFAAASVLNEIH